ncbi:hypothetical protein F5Y09DRAFT_297049 [Xylaria sp. FL1042]|nr:hypothetical protein F5Y09DRAFT_297049 [Xylaria sp. FL1042]
MAEPPRLRAPAGPITRKPVGLPTPPASVGPKTKSKAMKRQSSISSLLSAYSRSSSDWARRSSHESDFTKESEPSYSPEREDLNSLPPVPSKNSLEITNDTTSDKASEITSYTIIDHFPPPPPLKNPSRPSTPPSTSRRPLGGSKDREGGSTSPSPSTSTLRSGSPRIGREIWRRRASSKSDAGLVIAELKLPSSNGSTASTSHPPPKKAEPPSLPPPLPIKPDSLPALPALPLPPKEQHKQQQQSAPTTTTTTLPPRTTSLPGKNIRPIKQTEPSDTDDEMGKFKGLAKLKGLIRRGNNDDSSDDEQKQSQKLQQKASVEKSEQYEHHEMQNLPDIKGKFEADKPAPPAKDVFALQQHAAADAPANAPTSAALEASVLSTSSDTPAPPLNEPGKATGTAFPRRAVGTVPTRIPNQSDPLQLEPGKRHINKPKAPSSSIRTLSSLMPIYEGPHLPHPEQGVPPRRTPQPPPLVYSHPIPQDLQVRKGPTSPTGATPKSSAIFTLPSQSGAPMAGPHQAPGAISTGGPNAQPQFSKPALPKTQGELGKDGFSLQELIASPPLASGPASNPSFLTQAPASNKERKTIAPGLESDGSVFESNETTEQSMSSTAAAAIALFPRGHRWNVKCTVDGVWPPNPVAERHYNCIIKHTKLVDSPNTNYPLACQTCGIADKKRRFMCAFCNLRICQACADILVGNRRDLRVTMEIIKERGMMHDWDEYPKQNSDFP